jgi:hypothetical protein
MPASVLAVSAPLQTGVVNVRDFGAKGDGKTDDTAAIRAAVEEMKRHLIGVRATHAIHNGYPELFFPTGAYRVSDAIVVPGDGITIRGAAGASITQTDPSKDILATKWAWRMTISGLTFVNGRRQLALVNSNLDSGMITIEDCRFLESAEQAIETSLRSTIVWVEKSTFVMCEQALTTTTDMVTLRDCWITSKASMSDKAVIEARGDMMVLDNLCLVPLVGGIKQRWIDNYSGMYLTCRQVRFGGEGGGFTPVYNFAKPRSLTGGPNILFDQCYVGANGSYIANCAVYCVEVPNKIEIRGCTLAGSKPVIVSDKLDLRTYFTGINPKLLNFTAVNNIGDFADELPPLLRKPLTPPDRSKQVGISDKEAKALLAKATAKVRDIAGTDATGLSVPKHSQHSAPGTFIDLSPAKVKWDLQDRMDATATPNGAHLALTTVGTDILIMRRTPTTEPSWPHILIGPIELDLDKTPWLTWKQKDPGTESPKTWAVRAIDLETGAMALLIERHWPPYYDYHAFDLRKIFNIPGGKRRFMLKFYYLGMRPIEKTVIDSQTGDFMLLDFLRAEAE